ncbi:MAG: hypothetical protein AB8B50_16185 [Pirellulaceae bacterium]
MAVKDQLRQPYKYVAKATHTPTTSNRWMALTWAFKLSFLVLCLGTLGLGSRVWRVTQTEAKLKSLQADYSWSHDVISTSREDRPSETHQLLAKLLGNTVVSDVSAVRIGSKSPVNERQLEILASLPQLQMVSIDCNAATDRTLEMLSHVPDLRYLSLAGNRFSIAGLLQLRHAHNLKKLEIDTSHLSAVELAVLKSELRGVRLSDKNAPIEEKRLMPIEQAA